MCKTKYTPCVGSKTTFSNNNLICFLYDYHFILSYFRGLLTHSSLRCTFSSVDFFFLHISIPPQHFSQVKVLIQPMKHLDSFLFLAILLLICDHCPIERPSFSQKTLFQSSCGLCKPKLGCYVLFLFLREEACSVFF